MPRKRKIPQRTCIICRSQQEKRSLIRIVRKPDGEVTVDPTGKMAGRGAYLCGAEACVTKAFQGNHLAHALKVEMEPSQYDALRRQLEEWINREPSS